MNSRKSKQDSVPAEEGMGASTRHEDGELGRLGLARPEIFKAMRRISADGLK